MVTTELRTDPITGRTVTIELDAFKRRSDFETVPSRVDEGASSCALCAGRESEAGTEILAWRDGGPPNVSGWSVRVVANRHPMLRIEGSDQVRTDGLFSSRDGLGAHEVIIETPMHDRALQSLDADVIWRTLWAWRTRLQDLKRDRRFASAVIFKNHGRAAGARLDHAHSQLVAFPMLPPSLADQLRGAARHLAATGRCVFCSLASQELRDRRRVIAEHTDVLTIAPFASRLPFETWLLPREHAARFEDISDGALQSLAVAFKQVMGRIDWALERPAYNLALYTAPFAGDGDAAFHWHVEILPRVTRYGGLEWASGVHRNPVSPEEAARALRG